MRTLEAARMAVLLAVLSGNVQLANAQGQVQVGPNEAAIAQIGKAPVKLLLTQPRDRVQWVNALQARDAVSAQTHLQALLHKLPADACALCLLARADILLHLPQDAP